MRENEKETPSYYDIPMVKHSEWTWMIPPYFALGGITGASFVLARTAERFGGPHYRGLTRVGVLTSAAAFAPCPPLLILDLGDPMRFHHMLRVFKPQSPMNVGSWTLTALSGCIGVALLREIVGIESPLMKVALAGADLFGIPLGLMMAAYTGVLISTTSTPVWTQNPWLGALFSASAFDMAAASVTLGVEGAGQSGSPGSKALEPMSMIARFTTAATLAGYLISAGELAQPLTTGKYRAHIWGGAVTAGLVLPTVLEKVGRKSSATKITAAILALFGGFCLKWAIGSAGHVSGKDARAARQSTRKRN
ncbi:MAG TPA: NrfD/PsrC family molybdoenzyme membrane anchor subunit [Armatimonadota bacterium]|nr:NrfD/PsrC family molybdoenzyme membrane anchor subunit [Armatimonadota bacterium]